MLVVSACRWSNILSQEGGIEMFLELLLYCIVLYIANLALRVSGHGIFRASRICLILSSPGSWWSPSELRCLLHKPQIRLFPACLLERHTSNTKNKQPKQWCEQTNEITCFINVEGRGKDSKQLTPMAYKISNVWIWKKCWCSLLLGSEVWLRVYLLNCMLGSGLAFYRCKPRMMMSCSGAQQFGASHCRPVSLVEVWTPAMTLKQAVTYDWSNK